MCIRDRDWHVFAPATGSVSTGLILYPGGFVDPVAYAPIAREIAARGYLVVLDPMPLNLAVTDIESADAILGIFADFHQVGVTVVVATHDQHWIQRYHPNVLCLDHGRMAA